MATYDYLFNEGSGSIINEVSAGPSLSLSGSFFWGSDYLQLSAINTANFFNASNGIFSDFVGDSFSIVLWYEPTALSLDQYRSFLTIGDGALGNSLFCSTEIGTGKWWVSVNQTTGLLGGSPSLSTGVKYMFVITYNRVGGVSNNIMTLRWTSDGVTWNSNSRSNMPLINVNGTFELRSNYNQGSGGLQNTSGRYYRLTMYEDLVLDNSQMQAIFDAGSEGSAGNIASLLNLKTLGSKKILRLSETPNSGLGFNAPIASLAFVNNSGVGEMYLKTGISNTAWNKVSTI